MKEQEEKEQKKRDKLLAKEYEKKTSEIEQEFSKEKKKVKATKGSRAENSNKIKERSNFLTKAIIVVGILLIILFYFVFFG